jgi:hypothetical protein
MSTVCFRSCFCFSPCDIIRGSLNAPKLHGVAAIAVRSDKWLRLVLHPWLC